MNNVDMKNMKPVALISASVAAAIHAFWAIGEGLMEEMGFPRHGFSDCDLDVVATVIDRPPRHPWFLGGAAVALPLRRFVAINNGNRGMVAMMSLLGVDYYPGAVDHGPDVKPITLWRPNQVGYITDVGEAAWTELSGLRQAGYWPLPDLTNIADDNFGRALRALHELLLAERQQPVEAL